MGVGVPSRHAVTPYVAVVLGEGMKNLRVVAKAFSGDEVETSSTRRHLYNIYIYIYILVGGFNPFEKY